MCATKMSIMKVPESPDEHLRKPKSPEQNIKIIPASFPSLAATEHHVLSRHVRSSGRAPSVPNLLNIGSNISASPKESQGSSSSYFTTSPRERIPLQTGTRPAIETPGSRDERGNIITPPSSGTQVQFKIPRWKSSTNDQSVTETSPISASSAQTPTRLRQTSIESLMRAAATLENDCDINQLYQDKLTSIIELKNKISNEIRAWPVSKNLTQREYGLQNASQGIASNRKHEEILLDRISSENLESLSSVTDELKSAVRELIDLKNNSRYVEESIAAKLQQELHIGSSQRKVTLPPIETLTMNLPTEQTELKSYRFPEESDIGSPITPTSTGPFNPRTAFQESHAQIQASPSQYVTVSSWPKAATGHRTTLSDPSTYRNRVMMESSSQGSTVQPLAPGTAMPIIFKNPHSSLQSTGERFIGKNKMKGKSMKKRKQSFSESSSQDYRRSLTHGLMLAENIRKNEQSTTSCVHCGEGSTPEWRRGPYGNRTLCNACGLFYRKLTKKFGVKDANMLMRFKRQINPEDRRVPSVLNVPASFVSQLDDDNTLDVDYNTIGGATTENSGS